jgi:hypothetical protein
VGFATAVQQQHSFEMAGAAGGTPPPTSPSSHAFGSPVLKGDAYAQSVREACASWDACVQAHGGLEALSAGGLQVAAALSNCGGVGCVAHRKRLWTAWCGVADPEQAYAASCRLVPADVCAEQVELDLLRTAPGHPWLSPDGPAVPSLRRLLLALSAHQPYVQGQNFAAAFALLNLLPEDVTRADDRDPHVMRQTCEATEALAFVVLRCLLHSRLQHLYYSPRMADLRADLAISSAAFRARAGATGARVTAALAEWHLDVGALLPKPLLCAFVGAAPDGAVLRLWDVLLCAPVDRARPACVHAAEALLHCAAVAIETGGLSDTQDLIGALRSAGRHVTDVAALSKAAGAAVAGNALLDAAISPPLGPARRRGSFTPPPNSSRVLRSADVNQPASTTASKRRRSPPEAQGAALNVLDVVQGTANALWHPVSTVLRTIGVGVPQPASAKRARTSSRAFGASTPVVSHGGPSIDALDGPASGSAAAASPSSWLCATPCRGSAAAHGAEEVPGLELSALKSRRGTPVRHMR